MINPFREPPPIEELSEISWKRVEQGLFNAIDSDQVGEAKPPLVRRSHRFRAGALVFVTVAAAVFFVVLIRDGKTNQAPNSAESISKISTLESPTSIALLGAHLEVHSDSEVAIEQHGENLAFRLEEGGISLQVEARDHKTPVSVTAGGVLIEVVGTKFSVYRSMGQTQVVVDEGIVAVSRGNSRDLVRAGERWPAAKVPAAVASVAKLDAGPDNAPTVRHPAPAHVEPRELFEQAAAKEHSAPSEALRLYRRAARVGGPWAANALFAQARLLLAQGDLRKAKSILLRYVKRFPAGPNVTDARELLKGLE